MDTTLGIPRGRHSTYRGLLYFGLRYYSTSTSLIGVGVGVEFQVPNNRTTFVFCCGVRVGCQLPEIVEIAKKGEHRPGTSKRKRTNGVRGNLVSFDKACSFIKGKIDRTPSSKDTKHKKVGVANELKDHYFY